MPPTGQRERLRWCWWCCCLLTKSAMPERIAASRVSMARSSAFRTMPPSVCQLPGEPMMKSSGLRDRGAPTASAGGAFDGCSVAAAHVAGSSMWSARRWRRAELGNLPPLAAGILSVGGKGSGLLAAALGRWLCVRRAFRGWWAQAGMQARERLHGWTWCIFIYNYMYPTLIRWISCRSDAT